MCIFSLYCPFKVVLLNTRPICLIQIPSSIAQSVVWAFETSTYENTLYRGAGLDQYSSACDRHPIFAVIEVCCTGLQATYRPTHEHLISSEFLAPAYLRSKIAPSYNVRICVYVCEYVT